MTPLCPEQTITILEATGRCQGPGKESRAPAGSTDAGQAKLQPLLPAGAQPGWPGSASPLHGALLPDEAAGL